MYERSCLTYRHTQTEFGELHIVGGWADSESAKGGLCSTGVFGATKVDYVLTNYSNDLSAYFKWILFCTVPLVRLLCFALCAATLV